MRMDLCAIFLALFSCAVLAAQVEKTESEGSWSPVEGKDFWYIEQSELPTFMVVLEGATKVKAHVQADGSTWVTYVIETKYPASDVISDVGTHLENADFTAMKHNWLNPGSPSSIVRGWGGGLDSTVSPPRMVRQWLSDWLSEDGDIVTVVLHYYSEVPEPNSDWPESEKPTNDLLEVTLIHFPTYLVEARSPTHQLERQKRMLENR